MGHGVRSHRRAGRREVGVTHPEVFVATAVERDFRKRFQVVAAPTSSWLRMEPREDFYHFAELFTLAQSVSIPGCHRTDAALIPCHVICKNLQSREEFMRVERWMLVGGA